MDMIELVFARDRFPKRVSLPFREGMTVREALSASGLLKLLERGEAVGVGIFGRPVPLEWELRPGDRVELYRPLRHDPVEARRLRAAVSSRQSPRRGQKARRS